MTAKQNGICFLLVVFMGTLAIGEDVSLGLYAKADKDTQKKIMDIEHLIAARKYMTAFDSLKKADPKDDNPFLLAKKVEICINYFTKSIMHQIFCLKDLEPNESLEQLREGVGSFGAITFDPEKRVSAYIKKKGKSGILFKILGDYYYDITFRYGGQWLISEDELDKRIFENYLNAEKMGFFDVESLANLGEIFLKKGNFPEGTRYIKQAIKLGGNKPGYHYNLGAGLFYLQQYDEAEKEIELAIQMYEQGPYKMDAYYLASRIAEVKNDAKQAIRLLETALAETREDYRPILHLHRLYLQTQRYQDAVNMGDLLFSKYSTNPNAIKMIVDNFFIHGEMQRLMDFFDRNIEKYASNNEVLGNLKFHKALILEEKEEKEKAFKALNEAERHFRKVFSSDHQVFKNINDIKQRLKK
ncbi:MAG: hypothetical protein GTN73_07830 [Candidatus Aminicenantes bacterium]|nr:hypothetical protein [Candidatus Aminicenantes bacterium]